MTDHFDILQQPSRPWLDPAALKEAFHRATAGQHPDAPGGSDDAAAALNAAYAVLREPAARLRHLLELEWPAAPAPIPPALADSFTRIATLRQAGAALTKKQTAAQSPLARALLASDETAHRHDLEAALSSLESNEAEALAELRALDAAWEQREASIHVRLAAVQQHFAFLAKWQAQLREDLFKLGAQP